MNDCKFHRTHPDIFSLASEDTTVSLWDLRRPLVNPFFTLAAHKEEVFSVDFNPFNEFVMLSSCADGLVSLWDLRNLSKAVYSFDGHKDKCTKVKLFYSCSRF